jgi:THO complex subunit 6
VLFLFHFFASFQILAVGAEPVLSRFTINGTVLSQIKCAPQSAFSVSIHSSGVCTYLPADPHLNFLVVQHLSVNATLVQMASVAGYGGLVDVISELGSHLCTFGSRGLDK